jgi:chaperone BCS1
VEPVNDDSTEDEYFGFELDGNGRLLLEDFTVMHNTSSIKAIANVTKRHIINVRFSEIKTNNQLKNLFQDDNIHVIDSETFSVEVYKVPINQRLFIIEDIDCMTDIIRRRDLRYAESESDDETPPKNTKQVKARGRKPGDKNEKTSDKNSQRYDDMDLDEYYAHALVEEQEDMKAEREDLDNKDKITLDSILNILDGTFEIPNRIVCITTNHLEIIDPALIRPGRVDQIIEFNYCSRVIIKEMFDSFYEQTFDPKQFANIKDHKLSPALINQIMFKHLTDPNAAIEELYQLSSKRKKYSKRADDDK